MRYPKENDMFIFLFFSDWSDMPQKRSPKQYYVFWVLESAHYPFMDIHPLNNYFNWTMTYRKDSDFSLPYGNIFQLKYHPPFGPKLDSLIQDFGMKNQHLAHNRTKNVKAAWFVSNCFTRSQRELFVYDIWNKTEVVVMDRLLYLEFSFLVF